MDSDALAEINMNNNVRVKLTTYGLKVFKAHYKYYGLDWTDYKFYFTQSKQLQVPLWELMKIFGNCLYMGNLEIPFQKNRITIVKENL